MSKATDLLTEPEFIAALKSEKSARKVGREFGVSADFVIKYRGKLTQAGELPVAPTVTEVNETKPNGEKIYEAPGDRTPNLDDWRKWISSTGDDPDMYAPGIRSTKRSDGTYWNQLKATLKPGLSAGEVAKSEYDLPLLYGQIAERDATPPPVVDWGQKRALVVVWADPQVGKTGSRGGTPELIARVQEKREKLKEYAFMWETTEAYFLSVGDEVESFENTPQQAFTNDLSFPDQLDLELTFELDIVTDLAQTHEKVKVGGISSNHCRWRAGKNALGLPKDDFGLYLKRQLEKALRLNPTYDHVTFQYPEPWDETMSLDVLGTQVGMAHGHQVNNPNGIETWWQKQTFGAQATAQSDVLLTGHFHTFRAQPVGRSLANGKNRWWLQAPTLDSGSDWFRNIAGSDSDAGLMVFTVTDAGFDLQSLTIL